MSEAPKELGVVLEYPLEQTLASAEAKPFLEDNLKEVRTVTHRCDRLCCVD